jgi:hypothetical protein
MQWFRVVVFYIKSLGSTKVLAICENLYNISFSLVFTRLMMCILTDK